MSTVVKSLVRETHPQGMLFLDSGAHSLYNMKVLATGKSDNYGFFETQEFWDYVDSYAEFLKKNKGVIDYYVNIDVIFNPEMSWKVLKYLEKQGLNPVPVIHCNTDLKWIKKHLDAGYDFLGIGGLGQGISVAAFRHWADGLFAMLCPPPSHLPIVRTHGFAMTAYKFLIRFPWWSVDSASWTKVGAFGNILVPHKRDGKFTFDEQPYVISTSQDSPNKAHKGRHYLTLSRPERIILDEWLEHINIPLGKNDKEGTPIEFGVTNRHVERKVACLLFFEELVKWLPKYPWPFIPSKRKRRGFGL